MIADIIVKLYRLIPPRIRGGIFRGWSSTSHLYSPGDGFSGIIKLIGDSKVPRPPMPD